VPWADEAEQQFTRLASSGCQLSADVRFFGVGLRKEPGRDTHSQDRFEVRCGKTSKQPQSLCLCASSAMGRWGWATAFQASHFWLPAICKYSYYRTRAAKGAWQGYPLPGYVWRLMWQDKHAAPVYVPLYEQCHGQMRLSNSFPG